MLPSLYKNIILQKENTVHLFKNTYTSYRFLNNSPKFNNSLFNLLFQLFSIKIVSFREIRYIKIAETHCFQQFYSSNIFASAIPTLFIGLCTGVFSVLFRSILQLFWLLMSVFFFYRFFCTQNALRKPFLIQ